MNKVYDMKEYNKFPKLKATPWKSVLIWVKVVTSNQRRFANRFDRKDITVFSFKKNYISGSSPAWIFRWYSRWNKISVDVIKIKISALVIRLLLGYKLVYLE
jgi:hypothetical protein